MTLLRCLQAFAVSSLLLAGACTATTASTAAGDASQPAASSPAGNTAAGTSAAALLTQLQQAVGTAACKEDAECRTLPVGAKACGGPSGYIAWSATQSDGALLERLAREHAKAESARNARSGMVSNCMMESDPGARCVAQRCVLRGRGAAAAQ
ncbi:hypothetical protein [Ideonella sp. BN130291]|uniref:hypothetical protein n=1 Tax=Ideonella sp. BN130291 TaxID=3112940 RepID=UPI002E256337|nr:hypothetical protein [Ideonella sp. BN130291]